MPGLVCGSYTWKVTHDRKTNEGLWPGQLATRCVIYANDKERAGHSSGGEPAAA